MEEKKKSRKLIMFFICLLFLALMIGFILPGILPYKPPKTIVCGVNVHYLGICFQLYHHDNDVWPDKDNWCNLLEPYFEDDDKKNWLWCPADKVGPCSYAMNENIPADADDLPDDLVLLFESAPGWNQTGGIDDVVTDRHKRPGAHIGFAGGQGEFVKAEDIPKLRWTIEGTGFPPSRE